MLLCVAVAYSYRNYTNQIDYCKIVILLIITTINVSIMIYIYILFMSESHWMCAKKNHFHFPSPVSNISCSCPHHEIKFYTVLTAYVIWYDSFCALKNVFHNWISICKMHWLGGETDSAIRWRTGVTSPRGTTEAGC